MYVWFSFSTVLLLLTTTSTLCTAFSTRNSNVRTSQALSAILEWSFNSSQTVFNGDCHYVTCSVVKNGTAVSVGNWSLTSVEINPQLAVYYGDRLTMSCNVKQVTLTISSPQYADSGNYFCTHKNTTVDINLTVSGGPTLLQKNFSSSVFFQENISNSVEMTYCGNPVPMVEWEFLGIKTISLYEEIIVLSNSTSSLSQRSFCYRYVFTTPKLSRHLCPSTLRYTVSGFLSPTTYTSNVTLKYLPETLDHVTTIQDGRCLLTSWNGPSVGPLSCKRTIEYDVTVKLRNGATQTYPTFSSSFLLCNDTVDLINVTQISVRQRNQYGNGTFVTSVYYTKNSSVDAVTAESERKSFKMEFISVLVVIVTLLLVVFVVISIFLCKRYCVSTNKEKIKEEENKDSEIAVIHQTPRTAKMQRKEKFNTIRKQDIIPKHMPIDHVITKPVSKSNTFHGTSFTNRFSTDVATLNRAYMPMNTLQRRISEQLAVYGQSSSCQTLPGLSHRYVIENNNIEYDRPFVESSESVACTPEETRREEMRENLIRMSSVDSTRSEYDIPRRIRKAISIYDLPRCKTIQNGALPPHASNRAQSMYDPPQSSIVSFPHVDGKYSLQAEDTCGRMEGYVKIHRKVSQESATSDYSTPRNTIFEDEEEVDDGFVNAEQLPKKQTENDTNTITAEQIINKLPPENTYDRPSDISKIRNVEVPCASRVDGLYDTPRNCQLRRKHLLENRSQSVEIINEDFDKYDKLPRRATLATSENLYDSIINVLDTNSGVATTVSTPVKNVIYEELPVKDSLNPDTSQLLESSLADFSVA